MMMLKHKQTQNNYREQRHQLRCGEQIAYLRSGAHAANVDESQQAHQRGENDGAGQGILGVRKELADVNHKQVGVRRGRSHLPEPEHPGGLNPHETSEGNASVKIRTAGLLKARRNLGEAAHDHAHSGPGREHGIGAVVADERGHGRRQPKDSAADDGVHHQRNQAPAADGADQVMARRACRRRFHPRVCITCSGLPDSEFPLKFPITMASVTMGGDLREPEESTRGSELSSGALCCLITRKALPVAGFSVIGCRA